VGDNVLKGCDHQEQNQRGLEAHAHILSTLRHLTFSVELRRGTLNGLQPNIEGYGHLPIVDVDHFSRVRGQSKRKSQLLGVDKWTDEHILYFTTCQASRPNGHLAQAALKVHV
jgi:hypothetical protein